MKTSQILPIVALGAVALYAFYSRSTSAPTTPPNVPPNAVPVDYTPPGSTVKIKAYLDAFGNIFDTVGNLIVSVKGGVQGPSGDVHSHFTYSKVRRMPVRQLNHVTVI